MNKPKVYILQKDISDPRYLIKAGSRFVEHSHSNIYVYVFEGYTLSSVYVENNPDWFQPEGLYTKEQYIDGIKDAFESARLNHPMVGFKYDKVEDYLKTLIL